MDLSEIILRTLYLVFLLIVLFLLMKNLTDLRGNSLIVISAFGAVLILYVTFDYVNEFLMNNELILKLKKSNDDDTDDENDEDDTDDEADENNQKSNKTEITNELNVDKKRNVFDSNVINHTHKYINDRIFN